MATAAERMRALRRRRKKNGLREIRLLVPDPHSPAVRRRVAAASAQLNRTAEDEIMRWIEAVSAFDEAERR